jgi:hypothetical protein
LNDLTCYYDFENHLDKPLDIAGKYDFLENESIVSKLLEFEEPQLFHLVFLIYIVAHVFGFWKIYSVFRKG